MSRLSADRLFSPDGKQKEIATQLYQQVARLPLICPHGHVDVRMFADPEYSLGSPADLLIIPDHYVFRMLYSQGISPEQMGVPRRDGGWVESDHRKIWQIFAENFYLFRGTPSALWLRQELEDVFGVEEKLDGKSAQTIYDQIMDCLARPEYRPRALFERFNIEVLSTTDAATDDLHDHQAIRASGWNGRVVPCFRPDGVVNMDIPGWRQNIDALSAVSGIEVNSYAAYIRALQQRRTFFKEMGATATDHALLTAESEKLSTREADALFQRALRGDITARDAAQFSAHMLFEHARMSLEDGLVMQIHVGAFRNHNSLIFNRFGADKGCDIPVTSEFTRGLRPFLNMYGNETALTVVLFTLDETTYAREMATLAGHYPALRIGPPWWFYDSPNGMARYFDQIVETAGLYNTAGFNDDTRAFPSIPARHDVWRRAAANWIAGLVVRGLVDMDDAGEMILDAAYRLARKTYRFE